MSQTHLQKQKAKRGFTLVEMIVSLGIFAIVATVSLGALVHIVSANKKAQTLQSAITNLNFALETMSREMRVGSEYKCYDFPDGIDPSYFNSNSSVCPYPESAQIAFKSSKKLPDGSGGTCNAIIAYRFRNDANSDIAIEKAEQTTCTEILDSGSFTPLVSTGDVTITNAYLHMTANQYQVFSVRLSGYVGARERERSYFDVQTAVSSRLLDN